MRPGPQRLGFVKTPIEGGGAKERTTPSRTRPTDLFRGAKTGVLFVKQDLDAVLGVFAGGHAKQRPPICREDHGVPGPGSVCVVSPPTPRKKKTGGCPPPFSAPRERPGTQRLPRTERSMLHASSASLSSSRGFRIPSNL